MLIEATSRSIAARRVVWQAVERPAIAGANAKQLEKACAVARLAGCP